MYSILKYKLDHRTINEYQKVNLPYGSRVLHCDFQESDLTLWCQVPFPSAGVRPVLFYVASTGECCLPKMPLVYIKTVQNQYHIFKEP